MVSHEHSQLEKVRKRSPENEGREYGEYAIKPAIDQDQQEQNLPYNTEQPQDAVQVRDSHVLAFLPTGYQQEGLYPGKTSQRM
jgi:hypothetical protein